MNSAPSPEPQSALTRALNWVEGVSLLKVTGILAVLIVLLVTILMLQRVREAESEYRLAVAQIEQIQAIASSDDIYSLTREDMNWLEGEFATLQERIDNIEDLSNLPLGLTGAMANTPWVSDRYDAMMETLEVGRMMAESGQVIAQVGEEALDALDETGIRYQEGQSGETWLEVLHRREDELNEALDKMDDAISQRAMIDESKLPERILNRLYQIDAVIEEFSNQRELANDLPLAFTALGAEETVRYLALFQNPAETRPTGGFIGTIAFVELERGQILEYTFHDVYEISRDYAEHVDVGVIPPWAIAEYVRPDYLQFQDANWWADFPVSAELIREMTSDAGWGHVDSVVAVQPDTITDLLSITGPVSVDVDGEMRTVDRDNLLEESERQRRLQREGEATQSDHKEVISLIGEVILEQLAEGDREEMIDAAFLMFDALDRRDMQVYHSDDAITAFLQERNWAGLLKPDEDVPTIAPIMANITGLKTSLVMQPSLELELLEPDSAGVIEGILTLSLEHLGAEEGDPFYEGFQRWWVDLLLPGGASVVDTNPNPAPDPEASNGGAYVVNLPVADVKQIGVRFTAPATNELLLRRQPGLVTMDVQILAPGCDDVLEFGLTQDVVVNLEDSCPAVQIEDDDWIDRS
jgi:hypothetical protein